jgi:glycosyltransferase involved in cell wall biosynthesis
MKRTIIVIPTLNEYENVCILLDEFLKLEIDVVFVDDNSTDRTDQIIKNNIYFDKNIF